MKQFIVETSARHVHVTQQDLETLFGKGYALSRMGMGDLGSSQNSK